MPDQRQGGKTQPGGPALGPCVQQRERGPGQLDPGSAEQRLRLIEGETEAGRADLGYLAFQPQAVQP
jgi:hypothetical protein